MTKNLTETERKQLEKIIREHLESFEIVKTPNYDDSCGCYSEYTQESPRFYLEIKAVLPQNESEEWEIQKILDKDITKWANKNLDFSGCKGCDPYDDGDCMIVFLTLTPKDFTNE